MKTQDNSAKGGSIPQIAGSTSGRKEKKYYEVWADTVNTLYFLRTICFILVLVVFGLLILLKQSVNKLPLVVKVSKIGETQVVSDWSRLSGISPPEILYFTQTFIELFCGWDYYQYDENFRKAFKMMTPDCQKKLDNYLQTNKIVDQIRQAQYRTKITLARVDITKDSKDAVWVKVKGTKTQTSYLNPEYKKNIFFETELVLKKVKRTKEIPWGLLVDYYNETIFKEE